MNKRMISATRASSKTVLLIHPDNDYSQALKQLLVLHQFRVIHERTASEGIYRVLKGEVDVTIMNAALPDVDGYEVVRRLRANQSSRSLPVVAITAKALPGDAERALAAGCDLYMSKPIAVRELWATLERILSAQPKAQAERFVSD